MYQNATGPATDGWVSVWGLPDFKRAFRKSLQPSASNVTLAYVFLDFLNGANLNGQSLLAFSRNENEYILLRDPVPPSQTAPRSNPRPSSSRVGSSASNHHGSEQHQVSRIMFPCGESSKTYQSLAIGISISICQLSALFCPTRPPSTVIDRGHIHGWFVYRNTHL